MDKYVAQLQQDTGATPQNIVEAAGGSGGRFNFTITGTITPGSPPTISFKADKTYAEIVAANEAGQAISAFVVTGTDIFSASVNFVQNTVLCWILQIDDGENTMGYSTITIDSSDAVTYHAYTWVVS